jgi:hypothetical protein
MPGCLLRIISEAFDAKQAVADCSLVPCKLWRQGDQKGRTSTRLHENGGATFLVSDADGGQVPAQVSDAICFLQTYRSEIAQLVSTTGVEQAYLDFGWDFPYQRSLGQWNFFPIELLKLCCDLGLSICVSVYGCSDGDAEVSLTPIHKLASLEVDDVV